MTFPRFISFGFPAAVAAVFAFSNLNAADTPDNLEAFRQKVAAKEAKGNQKSPYPERSFSVQIKMLQNLIAREDYDRALQTIEGFGGYGLPPEFQDDWGSLSENLSKALQKRKAEQLEKWSNDIDRLVKDTKAGCLEAKTSDDLTSLLLRCSALQMRQQRENSVMSERINRKLSGVSATLSGWADYLDFKNAGNAKGANERLRNLLSNNSTFPVVSATEIESLLASEPTATKDVRTVIADVFQDVKSPDDLSAALERLKSLGKSPLSSSGSELRSEQSRIEAYLTAWQAAQAGDVAEVSRGLSRSESGLVDTQSYYAPLKAQIETRLLLGKAASWTKLTPNSGESSASYIGRILDELKAKGDYVAMADVLDFSARMNRNDVAASTSNSACIRQYLAGKRLEEAGDGLAAIPNYRNAVASPESRYTPTAEAQAALKRLEQKYPDAFTGQNAILGEQIRMLGEQMQSLSGQLRMLQNRPPGRPY